MTVTQLVPRSGSLTAPAARALTDKLKADAEQLWLRLIDAYERGVHTALGYSSWEAYMQAEFGTSRTHGHRLLDAGRVARAIEAHSPMGERPSERVARELAPVRREEGDEAVAAVWEEAVEEHGPTPTAKEVRQNVRERLARRPASTAKAERKPSRTLTKEQRHFGNNLSGMVMAAEYVNSALAGRTHAEALATAHLLSVDEETWRTWSEQVKAIDNAARKLRRYIKAVER